VSQQVQLRHDTAVNWSTVTPAQGEVVVDNTNNRALIGDGLTAGGNPAAKLSEAVLNTAASNVLAHGPNGSKITIAVAEQLVSGLSGASVTAPTQIPNGALVLAVSARITTAITGATSFEVGVSGTLGQFGTGIGVTLGSTNEGMIGPTGFYSATSIILTAAGGNFTAGAVRLSVMYLMFTPPTS
jgi:hypothetical protein